MGVSQRIAALTAELDALLAESVDVSTSEQTAACHAWENVYASPDRQAFN